MKSMSNWHLYSYNDYETNRLVKSPWADSFTDIFSRITRILINRAAYHVTSVAVPQFYFNSQGLCGTIFATVSQKYSGNEKEVVQPVCVHNKFDPTESTLIEKQEVSIITIVPISGRLETLQKFLDNWRILAETDKRLQLIISVMDLKTQSISLAERIVKSYKHQRISIFTQQELFSRGPALQRPLELVEKGSLVFFCDVGKVRIQNKCCKSLKLGYDFVQRQIGMIAKCNLQ